MRPRSLVCCAALAAAVALTSAPAAAGTGWKPISAELLAEAGDAALADGGYWDELEGVVREQVAIGHRDDAIALVERALRPELPPLLEARLASWLALVGRRDAARRLAAEVDHAMGRVDASRAEDVRCVLAVASERMGDVDDADARLMAIPGGGCTAEVARTAADARRFARARALVAERLAAVDAAVAARLEVEIALAELAHHPKDRAAAKRRLAAAAVRAAAAAETATGAAAVDLCIAAADAYLRVHERKKAKALVDRAIDRVAADPTAVRAAAIDDLAAVAARAGRRARASALLKQNAAARDGGGTLLASVQAAAWARAGKDRKARSLARGVRDGLASTVDAVDADLVRANLVDVHLSLGEVPAAIRVASALSGPARAAALVRIAVHVRVKKVRRSATIAQAIKLL